MKLKHSNEYGKPCIAIESGDSAEDVIKACIYHGALQIVPDDVEFIVQFPDQPQGLCNKERLEHSLSKPNEP